MKKLRSLMRSMALSFRVIFGNEDTEINAGKEDKIKVNRFFAIIWLLALMLPSVLGVCSNKVYAMFIDRLGEVPLSLAFLGAVLFIRVSKSLFEKLKSAVFERLARDADRKMSLYTIKRISNLQQLDFDCADRFKLVKPIVKSELSLWNLNWQLIALGSAIVSVVGTLGIALFYRPMLVMLAFLLAVPVIALEMVLSQYEELTNARKRTRRHVTEYYEKMLLDPARVKELKLFGESANMLARWESAFRKNCRASFQEERKRQVLSFPCELCKLIFIFVISWFCAFDCLHGRITLGDYSLYTANFALMFGSLKDVASALHSMLTSDGELEQFTQFTKSTAHGEHGGKVLEDTDLLSIRFEHVNFSYGDREILRDINFTWESGESIALIGRNGSGKSTLIKLICGLYTPNSGRIWINDTPSEEYAQNELYRLFGVVYQDFCHFELSLRENIAAQRMDDRYCDEELVEVFNQSGLSNIPLPKGLDTSLGRRFDPEGIELSGGQWQKVAISRNRFGKRPLRIYDEPASALDSVAENDFVKNELLDHDCGMIVISHRLSIGRLTDKILLLENGEITETGTHDELMRRGGSYARMFATQASMYREGGEQKA